MSGNIRVEQMQQVVHARVDDYRTGVASARESADAARAARDRVRDRIARGEFGSTEEKIQAVEEARAETEAALAHLQAMLARGAVVDAIAEQSGEIFGSVVDDDSLRLEVTQRAELGDPAMEELRAGLLDLDPWWGQGPG